MLKEMGRIIAVNHDSLWVETIQRSTCGTCVAEKGCGQTLLARLGVKPAYLRVLLGERSAERYRINDSVTIGIPNDIIVRGSLLVYLIPLFLMLVFSGIAHTYFQHEVLSIVMGIVGFIVGGVLVRWHAYSYRNDIRHQPIIIDEYTEAELVVSVD